MDQYTKENEVRVINIDGDHLSIEVASNGHDDIREELQNLIKSNKAVTFNDLLEHFSFSIAVPNKKAREFFGSVINWVDGKGSIEDGK